MKVKLNVPVYIDKYESHNAFDSLCELRREITSEVQASKILKGLSFQIDPM